MVERLDPGPKMICIAWQFPLYDTDQHLRGGSVLNPSSLSEWCKLIPNGCDTFLYRSESYEKLNDTNIGPNADQMKPIETEPKRFRPNEADCSASDGHADGGRVGGGRQPAGSGGRRRQAEHPSDIIRYKAVYAYRLHGIIYYIHNPKPQSITPLPPPLSFDSGWARKTPPLVSVRILLWLK